MNRSFYIVISPAILVAAVYLAMNYGRLVPRWLAFSVAGVAVAALLVQAARGKLSRKT